MKLVTEIDGNRAECFFRSEVTARGHLQLLLRRHEVCGQSVARREQAKLVETRYEVAVPEGTLIYRLEV